MHAPLIFTSASHSINVQKMFKVVLSKVFDLRCNLDQVSRTSASNMLTASYQSPVELELGEHKIDASPSYGLTRTR